MATLTQVRETTRFLETGSRSQMLVVEASQVMPEGITRETIRRQPCAPTMASAHGSVLVDVDGDERTDLLFNHTALIHGHGYSPAAQAVARQSRQLEAIPFPNEHETASRTSTRPRWPGSSRRAYRSTTRWSGSPAQAARP